MNRSRSILWYGVFGALLITLFWAIQGTQGALEASLGWFLSFVPLTIGRDWLADPKAVHKISIQSGLATALLGMPFRFAVVIGGAGLVFVGMERKLGWVYWLNVVLCYQVALALTVVRSRSRLASHRMATSVTDVLGPERSKYST